MFFNEFDSSSKYESQMNQGEIELMVHLLSKIEFNFKKLTIISIFFFIKYPLQLCKINILFEI